MRLIRNEFVRFFALGFAGGALLVFGAMDLGSAYLSPPSLVPSAQAAATK